MTVCQNPMPLIHISMSRQPCFAGTARSLQAITLRMRPIRPAYALSGVHFFKAVSEGRRDFTAIAVCGGPDGVIKDYCAPCGVCRQVMREFCNPSAFRILVAKSAEDYREYTLEQLLPDSFGPNDLEK